MSTVFIVCFQCTYREFIFTFQNVFKQHVPELFSILEYIIIYVITILSYTNLSYRIK